MHMALYTCALRQRQVRGLKVKHVAGSDHARRGSDGANFAYPRGNFLQAVAAGCRNLMVSPEHLICE